MKKGKKILVGAGLLVMFAGCTAVVSEEEPEENAAVETSEEVTNETVAENETEKRNGFVEEETEEPATEETPPEEVEEAETEEFDDLAEAEIEAQEMTEQEFLDILEENMGHVAEIEFLPEHKMYRILPTDPAMVDAMEYVVQGYLVDEFMVIQENMETLSSTASEKLGEGYMITMANPANTENDIIAVMDGVTVYNAITEMQ